LKELRESLFWLRVSIRAELVAPEVVRPLLQEGNELASIIAKSVVTAKRGKSKEF
jgi:hypothetical protein